MTHSVVSVAFFLTLGALIPCNASYAQVGSGSETTFCYRGRPRPACSRFLITEIGADRIVTRVPTVRIPQQFSRPDYVYQTDPTTISAELGVMFNLHLRDALGATMLMRAGSAGPIIGAKGRYRRWLAPSGIALDVGAGIIADDPNNAPGQSTLPVYTTDVGINYKDYIALTTRVDFRATPISRTPVVSVGVRAGFKGALYLAATAAVVLLIGFAAGPGSS